MINCGGTLAGICSAQIGWSLATMVKSQLGSSYLSTAAYCKLRGSELDFVTVKFTADGN